MGLYFGMRNSIRKNGLNYESEKVNEFDPNPTNFIITKYFECNGNTAIKIKYPNCKNYEGIKIIVYKGVSFAAIRKLNQIDPHFTDENVIKPFARFEPTQYGWLNAINLLHVL